MPSYQFTGLVETMYSFDRDALDRPVGAVQPGDVREFDQAPDWQWVLAGDGGPAPASDPEPPAAAPGPDDTPAAPEPAAPVADGPQPAPPAVVQPGPQPFAVTTGT